MLLWIIFATLTACVVAFVLTPLIRPRQTGEAATVSDVYKDQLREVDAQVSAGLIGAAEGEVAKAEIGRRLLAVDAMTPTAPIGDAISRQTLKWLAMSLAGGITAIALGLYLWLGSPNLPGQPYAGREDVREAAEFNRMVAQIEQRIAADPNDVQGRHILARVYVSENRLADSVRLYDEVVKLLGDKADAPLIAEAAAAHMSLEGRTSQRAKELVAQALAKNPKDSTARHFNAEIKLGAGDAAGAIAEWEALLRDMKPDEPIRQMVEQRLAETRASPQKP
jgi:cytochrome c-type biogenesis protein CcmH